MTNEQLFKIFQILLAAYGGIFLVIILFVGYHFSVHLSNTRKPGLKTACRCEYEGLLKKVKTANDQGFLLLPSMIRIFVNKYALSVSCKSLLYMQGELHAALLNRSHELQSRFKSVWDIAFDDLPTNRYPKTDYLYMRPPTDPDQKDFNKGKTPDELEAETFQPKGDI